MKVLGFLSKKYYFDSFFFFFLISHKEFLKWMINVCPSWTYMYFEKQTRTLQNSLKFITFKERYSKFYYFRQTQIIT